MDEIDLEDLERELPSLQVLTRFARSLDRIPWFANLGEPLTPGARAAAEDALQTALEKNISGRQVSWETTGGFGFLTPVETWKSTSGHWCRRFNETISVNGSTRDRTAVACRVNGRWRLAEEA